MGTDGSIGYHEDSWSIDLFFDVYHSLTSYPSAVQSAAGLQPLTSQRIDSVFGGMALSGRF